MHKVLVNRLVGLSLPRKSVVRLTDRPDMTLDVYCGRKTTIQQQQFHQSRFSTRRAGFIDQESNREVLKTVPFVKMGEKHESTQSQRKLTMKSGFFLYLFFFLMKSYFFPKPVTVKILKIGTPEIITIIVLQLEHLDFTVQYCVQKMQTE